jgi:hypothetical protein
MRTVFSSIKAMRDKETLLKDFQRVKTLYQYLYMSKDHYIEVNNGVAVLRIRMTDEFRFKCKNLNFPDLPETDYTETMTLPQAIGIIYRLETQPCSKDGYVFKNMWEEIESITDANLALNIAHRR